MHWRTVQKIKRELPTALAIIGILVLCILAIVGALGATGSADDVTLERVTLTTDSGGAHAVTGTIRNITHRTYDHVEIDIQLLNANGDSVGRLAPETAKLAAGATWTFREPVERDVVGFRVKWLTCLVDGLTGSQCRLGRYIDVQ